MEHELLENKSAKERLEEMLNASKNQISNIEQSILAKTKEKETLESEYKQAEIQGLDNAKDLFVRKNQVKSDIEYLKSKLAIVKENKNTITDDIRALIIECKEEIQNEAVADYQSRLGIREQVAKEVERHNEELATLNIKVSENGKKMYATRKKFSDLLELLPPSERKQFGTISTNEFGVVVPGKRNYFNS